MKTILCLLCLPLALLGSQSDSLSVVEPIAELAADSLSNDTVYSMQEEDPFFARQDSMWAAQQLSYQLVESDTQNLNSWNYAPDSVPFFEDSIYQRRLAKLNKQTPFNLHYNKAVQEQINIYAHTYRKHVSQMLGKAQYYFPLFEEILDQYDLPLEFKYLAVVESALKPHARSRSAATGLWQFMYNTGKIYDLKVTSYIDERSDPLQSTIAACDYFTFLYKMFNDWELVLAAYNGGPGYVSRMMRKTGAKDYWSVRPFLRRETQRYVPKFIAVNYIMQHASAHNIYPTPYAYTQAMTDTVSISQSMSFETLSTILSMEQEELLELNPMYKKGLIPVGKGQTALLKLPIEKMAAFVNNEEAIYAKSIEEQQPYVEEDAPLVHRVKSGEFLGKIAKQYNTSVSRLMEWNNLRSTNLRVGQKLVVYINPDHAPQQISSKGTIEYTIRSGDTLWGIAKKQGVTVSQIERLNNISASDLKPGLKIKIPKA
jgi:membrane-bound lytic murein transglycosylase D